MASCLQATSPLNQPVRGQARSYRMGPRRVKAVRRANRIGPRHFELCAVHCRSALSRDGVIAADNIAVHPTRSRASALPQNGAKACRSSAPRQWNRPAAFRNSTALIVGARLPAMASYLPTTSPLTRPFAGKRAPTEWGQGVSKLCAVPTESARGISKFHAVNCRSALARDGVVPANNVAAGPTRSQASALPSNKI